MDDLLNEFLTETAESIAVIDIELVSFEQNPNDAEILQNIFRLVHTIKGTIGFLGSPRLEKVVHHGEHVLGKFREGELEVTPAAVTLILKAIDTIKVLLAELEDTGSEPEGDDSEIIAELVAIAEGRTADSGDSPVAEAEQAEPQPVETAPAEVGDDSPADEPGLIGTAILDGKATDIIEAGHYLTLAFDDWFSGKDGSSEDSGSRGKRVLLVDDSLFFRNLLTPMLSVAGYNFTTVKSAGMALSMCEECVDFDIIISDTEMPDMNGFEFAEAVRNASRWANVPMVALSSRTESRGIERGRSVGFNEYVSKSNRETLIQTLAETIDAASLEMLE